MTLVYGLLVIVAMIGWVFGWAWFVAERLPDSLAAAFLAVSCMVCGVVALAYFGSMVTR